VKPLCTSFPLNLRRIARSRAARVLVCVLALALSAANVLMVAMPSAAMAAEHGAAQGTASHQAGHAHCTEDSGAERTHAGHDAGGACCIGKSCACVHVCGDVPVLLLLSTVPAPAAPLRSAVPSRAYATLLAPLLRPPIA